MNGRARQKAANSAWMTLPNPVVDFGGGPSSGFSEVSVLSSAEDQVIDHALAEVFGIKKSGRRGESNSARRHAQLAAGQYNMDFVLSMPDLDSTELL